ncbi:MAG: tRNA pseudouridine(13) synthase TruD, partial [Candidatus Nanoarchaeia archaeon]|nr:tRNA pseudouridine(13) synthase TruD [Candidatus Jingweiarchaeum tengchongense]
RFGDKRSVNHLVGKEILKHNFKEAIRIFLCETDGVEYGKEAREYLARNWGNFKEVLKIFPTHLKPERTIIAHLSKYPNDYVGALRKLPKFLRLIFVNSYQSYLFNLTLDKLWENGMRKNVKVPMVGYNLKLGEDEISCIIKEIMRREGIGLEDFKVKSMPEMSVSGSERDYLFFPENFEILKISDNLVKVRFILKKGCYATTLLRELMKSEDGK